MWWDIDGELYCHISTRTQRHMSSSYIWRLLSSLLLGNKALTMPGSTPFPLLLVALALCGVFRPAPFHLLRRSQVSIPISYTLLALYCLGLLDLPPFFDTQGYFSLVDISLFDSSSFFKYCPLTGLGPSGLCQRPAGYRERP
jgi:hypothetical protein